MDNYDLDDFTDILKQAFSLGQAVHTIYLNPYDHY